MRCDTVGSIVLSEYFPLIDITSYLSHIEQYIVKAILDASIILSVFTFIQIVIGL